MRIPSPRASLSFLVAAAPLLFVSRLASADAPSCASDSDCARGFACQVVGGSTCASGGPACAPGDECPAPPACTPTVVKGCVPGPCTVDADCASGMVCALTTSSSCSGGAKACPPETECDAPQPSTCTTQTTGSCVPPYLRECHADPDCGPGFLCVAQQSCTCTGSGGSASGGGGMATPGADPPPPLLIDAAPPPVVDDAGGRVSVQVDATAPDCSCAKTGYMVCSLIDTSCATAADCPSQPAGWTCGPNGNTTVCAEPPSADGAVRGCPEAAASSNVCLPPYWNATLGGGHTAKDTSSGETSGASGGGASIPPASPQGTPSGGSSSSVGACQIGVGTSASGALATAWMAVAMLGLGLRRRRAR